MDDNAVVDCFFLSSECKKLFLIKFIKYSSCNAFYMHRIAFYRGKKVRVECILGTPKIEIDFLLCSWDGLGAGGFLRYNIDGAYVYTSCSVPSCSLIKKTG